MKVAATASAAAATPPAALPARSQTFAALERAGNRRQCDAVEVRVHPRHSRVGLPLQFGLYATAAHAIGERITAYGGILRWHTDVPKKQKSHSCRVTNSSFVLDGWPLARMYRRPTPATEAELQDYIAHGVAQLLPTAADFDSTDVERFDGLACGFMANTADTALCNACIEYINVRVGGIDYGVPTIRAIKPIAARAEILFAYHTHESKGLLTELSLQSARRSQPATPRDRSVDVRHEAQYRTLQSFATSHSSQLELMRYHVWTTASQRNLHIRIGPSRLLEGFVGVFATGENFRCSYPGMLMWKELHNEFNRDHHCPTAIDMPILSYSVDVDLARQMQLDAVARQPDGRWLVRMVLVGDPRAAGPLVNSPRGLLVNGVKMKPNVVASTADESKVHAFFRHVDGKIQVQGSLVVIQRAPKACVAAGDELFLAYDDSDKTDVDVSDTYWTRESSEMFCYHCFGKASDERGNALYVCSFTDTSICQRALHRDCFPANDGSYRREQWFCSIHRAAAKHRDLTVATPVKRRPVAAQPQPKLLDLTIATPHRLRIEAVASKSAVVSHQPVASLPAHHSAPAPRGPRPAAMRAVNFGAAVASSTRCVERLRIAGALRDAAPSPATPAAASAVTSSATTASVTDYSVRLADVEHLVRLTDADSSSDLEDSSDLEGLSDSGRSSDPGDSDRGSKCLEEDLEPASPTETQASLSRPLSFSKPKNSLFAMTDAGFETVRAVWKEFGPAILKANRRAKWQLRYDATIDHAGSDRENQHRRKLERDWNRISQCCGRSQALPFGKSPAALLRARLQMSALHNYDKAAEKNFSIQTFSDNKLTFAGAPVCDSCYCACIGQSSRTVRRKLTSSASASVRSTKKNGRSRRRRVASWLLQFAEEMGQHDPEGELGKRFDHVYVLPFITQSLAREALKEWVRQRDGVESVIITRSTFRRAAEFLEDASPSTTIHMKKAKKLAGCADCQRRQNALMRASKGRDQAAIRTARRCFDEHLEEEKEQRELFDEKRDTALAQPWELLTLTSDGMDSAKTRLPHFTRMSKAKDIENQLSMRVVGGIAYGSPLPCAAITAFDDVSNKGGAASITHLEQFLDLHWNSMDVTNVAPIAHPRNFADRGDVRIPMLSAADAASLSTQFSDALLTCVHQHRSGVDHAFADVPPTASPLPRRYPVQQEAAMEESAAAAHAAFQRARDHAQVEGKKPKAPFLWPRALHFTFDNTASDNKNRTVFNFIGMLVGIGLFTMITLSMLMVGHTHDIVDQMFSAWAKRLNVENAPTLSALRRLFRQAYGSQILEVKKKADKAAAGDRVANATLAAHLASVADLIGAEVALVRQVVCVEPFELTNRPIDGILNANVYLMRVEDCPAREAQEGLPSHNAGPAVVMYSRHLAKQSSDPQLIEHGLYKDVPHGPWSSKRTLFFVDEIPRDDPVLRPVQQLPLEGIERCVASHKEQLNFQESEAVEWDELLESFRRARTQQTRQCVECTRIETGLSDIGVIHRVGASASQTEKDVASKQTKDKSALRRALRRHLQLVPHAKHTGWWTK
jgi:hypothetical protein